jgi:hypothetical protein
MKGKQRQRQSKAVFDLIEEATHLLRTAPAATLAVYYLGAIPFVLGLRLPANIWPPPRWAWAHCFFG